MFYDDILAKASMGETEKDSRRGVINTNDWAECIGLSEKLC
jgi:hypothetical protein